MKPPLTDRLISRLPGPWWAWALVWAALTPLRPLINALVLRATGEEATAADLLARVLPHVVLGLIVFLVIWGSRLLWRRAQTAESAIARLAHAESSADSAFRGLGSMLGPLTVVTIFVIASEASNITQFPTVLAIVDTPMLAFVALPIAGFVWAYAAALVGVDRLGRQALNLDPFPEDRSLGLRSVGSLAFVGFAILSVAVVLYLLFLGHFLTDIVMAAGVFVFGAFAFVISVWRLHEQMVQAKRRHVEHARRLYGEAYAPLQAAPTLATLEQQAGLLGAAEALERRAEAIHEWPVDDRMVTRIAVIVTGVITGLALRLVFEIGSLLSVGR